ncbi:hypothetical protein BJP27_24115 (plasmid) [Pseudomonas oryzihabitans]|nr:hypothetical protein BJP27_24115 [Pseudomonas psychrotolerans]
MRCSALLAAYQAELPLGIVLTDGQVARNLKKALRFYCGFAVLTQAPSAFQILQAQAEVERQAALAAQVARLGVGAWLTPAEREALPQVPQYPPRGVDVHSPIDAGNSFTGAQDFDLTPSEYALIRPLFELYVELENAEALEASRSSGMDSWGRSTDAIKSEIQQTEERMPAAAFTFEIVTI